MPDYTEDWHPGSFTKNFGWGKDGRGLAELHQAIRVGFGDVKNDITRGDFRERLDAQGINFYIPANFFLFNYSNDTGDWIAFEVELKARASPGSTHVTPNRCCWRQHQRLICEP